MNEKVLKLLEDPETFIKQVVEGVMAEMKQQAAPTDDEWLTVADIAALTKFSQWTIYEAIKRGELEVFRPSPRRIRSLRSNVMDWARRKENEEKGMSARLPA